MLSLICIWQTQKLSLHEQRTSVARIIVSGHCPPVPAGFAPYHLPFDEADLPSPFLVGLGLGANLRLKASPSIWLSFEAKAALALACAGTGLSAFLFPGRYTCSLNLCVSQHVSLPVHFLVWKTHPCIMELLPKGVTRPPVVTVHKDMQSRVFVKLTSSAYSNSNLCLGSPWSKLQVTVVPSALKYPAFNLRSSSRQLSLLFPCSAGLTP